MGACVAGVPGILYFLPRLRKYLALHTLYTTMKHRGDLGPMAGGARVAATPLQAQDAPTYLFALYDIILY